MKKNPDCCATDAVTHGITGLKCHQSVPDADLMHGTNLLLSASAMFVVISGLQEKEKVPQDAPVAIQQDGMKNQNHRMS